MDYATRPGVPAVAVPDLVEDEIKRARLAQLELANEKCREDRATRSGRYLDADAVRQEMGRIAGRMVVLFDGAIAEFATAIAARSDLSSRDALHLLRETFRTIRDRASNIEAAAGAALPPVLADDEAA